MIRQYKTQFVRIKKIADHTENAITAILGNKKSNMFYYKL